MKTIDLKSSTTMRHAVGVTAALVFTASGSVVHAGTHCYDFSGPAEGTTYQVGQTVNARHSVINLKTLRTEDGSSQDPGEAEIRRSGLPQGDPPSLWMHSITAHVVPQKRVQQVTLAFAENTGQDDRQTWNLGVNGEQRVWQGRLARLNNEKIGEDRFGGKVQVSVNAAPDSPDLPTWIRGTLTLEADPLLPVPNRGIQTFSIGRSSQLFIDNVCITE